MMSANPRTRVARGEAEVRRAWTGAEIAKVNKYCDHINPPLPGGCKCSFPKCDTRACRKEIKDALR